eukprot:246740_1
MSENTEKCYCIRKCISSTYSCIRCCCCICGCFCTGFWLLLLWALISLSTLTDVDWNTTENTCYHKLHVTPESSQQEIQKAFRKLALKYHPDKVSPNKREESQKIFQEISNCYEILNDEKKRKQYDNAGYKETNFPFDEDINLKDIFKFFSENFEFDTTDGNSNENYNKNYRKNKKKQRNSRKAKKNKKK